MPEIQKTFLMCDFPGCGETEGTARYDVTSENGRVALILCLPHGEPVEAVLRYGTPQGPMRRQVLTEAFMASRRAPRRARA